VYTRKNEPTEIDKRKPASWSQRRYMMAGPRFTSNRVRACRRVLHTLSAGRIVYIGAGFLCKTHPNVREQPSAANRASRRVLVIVVPTLCSRKIYGAKTTKTTTPLPPLPTMTGHTVPRCSSFPLKRTRR